MASKVMVMRWSAIRAWRKCHQLYKYKYINLYKKRRPAAPLIRGSILGECLDQTADNQSYAPVIAKYQKEFGKLFKEEREEYGDILGECSRIVDNYTAHYKDDGLTYRCGTDGKPYEIEVKAEFKIDDYKIKFQGHIDKLVQDEKDRLLVMDHKSHRVIPDSSARFNDLQLLTYVWLLPQSNIALEADGVLWDYLRTKPPTIPEQLKNGKLTVRANLDTDYNTYLGEINRLKLDPADYAETLDRLKSQGLTRYFERIILPAPGKEMIKNVVSDFKETIHQIIDANNRGTYVRNMSKECSWCEFHSLCSAELRGLDTSFILKHEYVQIDGDDPHGRKTKRIKA